MREELFTVNLFDLEQTLAAPLLEQYRYPWEVLAHIHEFLLELMEKLPHDEYTQIRPQVWAANDAVIADTAFIAGPCIIGHEAKICHCAYVRGNALIGNGAEVGNSTEVKNSILFNRAQGPHFNYIGDSVLGYKAHMGAGAVTSNLKGDQTPVSVRIGDARVMTGLRKFGAMLGDRAEIGCNTVLNPGTVVGKHTRVYPLSLVRGYLPPDSIYKDGGVLVAQEIV